MSINFKYLFKYIIIGDSSVGKSNLLLRYIHDKFNSDYQATIGVEFGAKNLEINGEVYRIQVWDTAGQENFRSITRAYYKSSVCALVVYDISNVESFQNVQNWIEDCKIQSPKSIFMVLVGNKCDLDNCRKISYEQGKALADRNNMLFFETSALNGTNVANVFQESVKEISNRIKSGYYDLSNDSSGIKLGTNTSGNILKPNEHKSKSKRCCS